MQLTLKPAADQRIETILAAVRGAFVQKGFDGASMQDLARAAGMSVGNFYRYFPSKAAIVEAMIATDLAQMEAEFQTVLASGDPMQSLRDQARARVYQHQECCDGQLWAEITAVAQRKPEIGQTCQHMETTIAGYLVQAFAHVTGLAVAEAGARFGAHAAFVVMLVKSSAMLAPQMGPERDDLNALILRTLDQTLDEVASAVRKG